MRKGKKILKEERKTKPEKGREQQPVRTARERRTTTSGNGMNPLQIRPKKNNPAPIGKQDLTRQ
jgi:hypothetical protein